MKDKADRRQMKFWNKVIPGLYILMGVLFLPVLFCVIFVGNHMDYNKYMKLGTLLPNYILCMVVLLGLAIVSFLTWRFEKRQLTGKRNYIVNGVLACLFLMLYFANIWIAKEIIFLLPWDIMVVRGIAQNVAQEEAMGYFSYLSIYTNNIPISWILAWLCKKAKSISSYPYLHEFIWIQVNCALISIGGFFSCLTVKKLTRKIIPTGVAFLLYLALAGISAWKIAPYTDTYGMVFPIMSLYFYICYRDSEKPLGKYLFAALSIICGMAGGFIKPSVYVIIIAILGVELLCFFLEHRKNWKYFIMEIILMAVLFLASDFCRNRMIEDMGLDYNSEVTADWQIFFLMGLNEGSTGSDASEDAAIIGEFQTDRKARNEEALERAIDRIKERGFFGTVYFWLRKMVMTFNDGSFGWECEVWIGENYPVNMASDTAVMQELRNIFWPNMVYTGRYNTFCQLIWLFCVIGFSGILFFPKEQREKYLIFVVSFLGIFLYQMFFEARARYLFIFLPALIALSTCGIWQYAVRAAAWLQKRKDRKSGSNTDSRHEMSE